MTDWSNPGHDEKLVAVVGLPKVGALVLCGRCGEPECFDCAADGASGICHACDWEEPP